MAAQTNVNVIKSNEVRVFIQRALTPASAVQYYGCLSLGEAAINLGDLTPVWCPSSETLGAFVLVDEVAGEPELPTVDFTQKFDRFLEDIWWELKRANCPINLYVKLGKCQRPDNFYEWDSLILYHRGRMTSLTIPAMNNLTPGDNASLDLTGSITLGDINGLKQLFAGQKADATIVAEVLDGFYADSITCGDCGVQSDGCSKQYWLTVANSASVGLSSQLVYTIDNKVTYNTLDIPPLGGLSANRMARVGSYVVIVSEAAGNHIYALLSDVDDGLTSAFTAVTGYVAGKSPRCIFSKSPSLTYVGGQGGYVYLLTDAAATPTVLTDGTVTTGNITDIHGFGNTIVAVADNGDVIYSTDVGETWALVDALPSAGQLTAVWCLSATMWFVGDNLGALNYTLNRGDTWTLKALPSGATTVNDIAFSSLSVGWVAYQTGGGASAAKIAWTVDVGNSWRTGKPRMNNLTAANRYNVIAVCQDNEISIGGRETVGGDGIIEVAVAGGG